MSKKQKNNSKSGSLSKPLKSRRGPVMVDVQGMALTSEDRDRLMHPLVGGVILFARNFENREQLIKLTRQIHRLKRPRLLIAVDHEGGRVQRFRSDGFTHLPAMARLGKLWMKEPLRAMSIATSAGLVLAGELRACGVDRQFWTWITVSVRSSVTGLFTAIHVWWRCWRVRWYRACR